MEAHSTDKQTNKHFRKKPKKYFSLQNQVEIYTLSIKMKSFYNQYIQEFLILHLILSLLHLLNRVIIIWLVKNFLFLASIAFFFNTIPLLQISKPLMSVSLISFKSRKRSQIRRHIYYQAWTTITSFLCAYFIKFSFNFLFIIISTINLFSLCSLNLWNWLLF